MIYHFEIYNISPVQVIQWATHYGYMFTIGRKQQKIGLTYRIILHIKFYHLLFDTNNIHP